MACTFDWVIDFRLVSVRLGIETVFYSVNVMSFTVPHPIGLVGVCFIFSHFMIVSYFAKYGNFHT